MWLFEVNLLIDCFQQYTRTTVFLNNLHISLINSRYSIVLNCIPYIKENFKFPWFSISILVIILNNYCSIFFLSETHTDDQHDQHMASLQEELEAVKAELQRTKMALVKHQADFDTSVQYLKKEANDLRRGYTQKKGIFWTNFNNQDLTWNYRKPYISTKFMN